MLQKNGCICRRVALGAESNRTQGQERPSMEFARMISELHSELTKIDREIDFLEESGIGTNEQPANFVRGSGRTEPRLADGGTGSDDPRGSLIV